MATQDVSIHPFPAQERVAQTIPIPAMTVQPTRLHAHSTPSLIVPSRNHSQPHREPLPPTGERAGLRTKT